ncbi:hypothetical protein MASR2M69_20490 [Bacteroidota bacterium]
MSINFNDTKTAFASKSNGQLRNAQLLYSVIQSPLIVKAIKEATNVALNLNVPLGWAVKPTLYKQFVGERHLKRVLKL